jgi:hypothetical protein
MITIEKNLPTFAFAGNPMLMKLISDNIIETAGVKAYMELAITGADTTADHHFDLSFGNNVLLFTAATTPDDSGLQYEKASGTDTYITWAEKIYNALISNYLLATNYDIVLADAEPPFRLIIFTAKKAGSEFTIDFTNHDTTGIGEEPGNVPGTDPLYRENFVLVASIWEGSSKIAEDSKPVDTAGRTYFDFSEYLESLLETDTSRFTWPEVSETFVHEFSNYIQAYKVSLAEKYSGVVRKMTFDTERHAIGGGLSRETLISWNEAAEHFYDNTDNKTRFLTWAPAMRELGADVPQKLFFVFQSVSQQYRLCASVIFSDGSVIKKYCSDLAAATSWSVVECVAGYDQLNLGALNPSVPVLRWYMFLENELGNKISESRGYTLDVDVYETQRVFMFRNSFSAYDIVRFTGKGELSMEYDRVSGSRIVDEEYTSLNAPVKLFSSIESQKLKANSGWISLAEKKHLRDFLLSRETYEIVDDKLYPIIVTSQKSQAFTSDDVTLHSLDIDYDRSYNDMFWSDVMASAGGVVPTERVYSDDYNPIEYS